MNHLTDSQLADYHRDGFTACPGFFSADEVALMRGELDRLVEAGMLRNVHTENDGATHSQKAFNLQICPLSPRSPVFRTLPFADRVVAQIGAILGSDFYLRLDQIFLKPARHGVGTNWHQDNAYFRDGADHLASRGIGMWIALHDATVANGCMHVLPQAFARTRDHHRDPGSDHHITLLTTPVEETHAVPVELPAGGALFFNWGVPHCTKANTTDRPRAGLALHFQDLALRPAGHEQQPVLAGPGADGGTRIFGEDLRGGWERLVAAHQVAAG